MSNRPVVRFAVRASDGRRSAEWRLWTGDKKPTDETYLAPRSLAGDFKVSLHKSGYSQHGPTSRVRERVRPGARHALDRWESSAEVARGIRLTYALRFYERELRHAGELSASTLFVPASVEDGSTVLGVYITDHEIGETELEQLGEIYAVLPRASEGKVVLAGLHFAADPGKYEADLVGLRDSVLGFGWDWGSTLDERFGWMHGDHESGVHLVTELSAETFTAAEEARPALAHEGFKAIGHLDELPPDLQPAVPVCAVLIVPPRHRPSLFYDSRARCDFQAVTSEALALAEALRKDGPDPHWERLPDGSYVCALVTEHQIGPGHRDAGHGQERRKTSAFGPAVDIAIGKRTGHQER
ncbi:hypothetical protein [Cellulosimicrobium sp. SH8]|uniref:hypothetical protein n=1 Tax=Cellulosimicrobium sp. SH8 TaxID=2952936 RepID=UPI0021F2D64B|nr:hypothetical protein [Cellulosimicrobium sp. SH8]